MIAEINKMENLRHPNIMPLLGVCFDAGNVISIVMPFMANGSLLGYLKKQRPKLYLKNNANINHVRHGQYTVCPDQMHVTNQSIFKM